jgi:hypothetical protein
MADEGEQGPDEPEGDEGDHEQAPDEAEYDQAELGDEDDEDDEGDEDQDAEDEYDADEEDSEAADMRDIGEQIEDLFAAIEDADLDVLDKLAYVYEIETRAAEQRPDWVRRAKADGCTWEEIGSSIGKSKQAAQQRYGNSGT